MKTRQSENKNETQRCDPVVQTIAIAIAPGSIITTDAIPIPIRICRREWTLMIITDGH